MADVIGGRVKRMSEVLERRFGVLENEPEEGS
jgi:hypothetical protein